MAWIVCIVLNSRFEIFCLRLVFSTDSYSILILKFKGHSQGVGYGDGGSRPSEHQLDDALKRTGRLFGGLIADVKRKLPFYVSDWTDAFNMQCIASTMFLYFAVITPIITFGGLLADATQNNIAAMESMIGGAIAGSLYHIFSGQPLTIIGSTGPILVFETIMFHLCHDLGLDYLEMRVWVGSWIGILCLILVATDASYLGTDLYLQNHLYI